MHFLVLILTLASSGFGAVLPRANEPKLSYAPDIVDCPSNVEWVRPATSLSSAEQDWVAARKIQILPAFEAYLGRLSLQDFNVKEYIARLRKSCYDNVPTIGYAISGGGQLSCNTGTGGMRAFDNRVPAAVEAGTGGLLQSMTYISGQSGGSWPIVSFATNDFPTADDILKIWQPQVDHLNGSHPSSKSLFEDLGDRLKAGYNVSADDYIGRAASYEFLNGPRGGLNVTWSGVTNSAAFKGHQMPFPMVQVSEVIPGDKEYFGLKVPYSNATLYEVTPFEFGSWSGHASFTPTKWLGTSLVDGKPLSKTKCAKRFDTGSGIFAAAAGAYNFWYIEAKSNGTEAPFPKRSMTMDSSGSTRVKRADFPPTIVYGLATAFKKYLDLTIPEISYVHWPNPFYKSSGKSGAKTLQLVDATEVGQALPLWPHIQPQRKPNFLIAWDADGDSGSYDWNNGTNLYNTYRRAKDVGLAFPIVPNPTTFIKRNYTYRPVFFGCDTKLTTTESLESPIILYMADSPWSAYTNYTFFQGSFSHKQMTEIFENSFNQVTLGNGTIDKEWPACIGCSAIDRSLAKVGMKRTKQCEACFEKYCWDGTEEAESGPIDVDLPLTLDPSLSFAEWSKHNPF